MISALFLAAATLTVGQQEFPTYEFGDPDPTPLGWSRRYPYFAFSGYSDKAVQKKWQTVVLENAKTRVTIMPEIGGKVWGAEDKATGHEYIYFNHVVKFRNIAQRGPWTSGGIELNTGITGHFPGGATPTDWWTRENGDGSVSYFCGGIENVCRTFWQVEVRLGAEDDFFTTRMTRYNLSNLPTSSYQWMNAAYSAEHNAEFVFPGKDYIGHPGDPHRWPIDEGGRNIAFVETNRFCGAKSYHAMNGDNGLFAIWYHDFNFGAYHQTERYDKYGRKIWLWPLSRNGGIWTDLLTDNDGNYTELQSGRLFQQPESSEESTFGYTVLDAGAHEEYVEKWGAVRDRATLDKMATEFTADVSRPLARPADYKSDTPAALWRTARQYILDHKWDRGESLLDECLKKEPCFVPALESYAYLMLERGNYAKAREYAAKAMAVDTYTPDANYADAVAAFALGLNDLAIERFGVAAFATQFRAPAFAFIARIRLRQGNWADARKLADRALESDANNFDAIVVKAAALRHMGDKKAAKAVVEKAMVRYPLYQFFRYENFKCGGEDYISGVKTELPNETAIDLGSWYEESGLAEEALEQYGYAKTSPIAAIRAAYLLHKLGKESESSAMLKELVGRKAAYVTPFRRESRPALEWANETAHDLTWKIPYFLSVYLEGRREGERARELLNGIAKADEAVFYLHRLNREPNAEQKWADVEMLKTFPDSWRTGCAIANAYRAEENLDAACDVLADYLKRYPHQNCIELYYAQLLYKTGRYDTLISYFLDDPDVHIKPSEYGGSAGWWIENACADLCKKALAAGNEKEARKWLKKGTNLPENVGSGKPYAEDLWYGIWPKKYEIELLCEAFNERYGQKGAIEFVPNSCESQMVMKVTGPCGTVALELHGAKNPTWTVTGAEKAEKLDFGTVSNDLNLVSNVRYLICHRDVGEDKTVVAMEAEWSPYSTLKKWPGRYHQTIVIEIGKYMGQIKFITKNIGVDPFEVPDEFHPPKKGMTLKPGETCTKTIRL